MNQEIKAKWVDALRSGEYQQTRNFLKRADGFCCLGVLCDLHSKTTNYAWHNENYLNQHGDLPRKVIGWAEIGKDTVEINDSYASLAEHNDNGRTFLEIADAIESQL